jgi:hypothetical protein
MSQITKKVIGGLPLTADVFIDNCLNLDLLIIPGGSKEQRPLESRLLIGRQRLR